MKKLITASVLAALAFTSAAAEPIRQSTCGTFDTARLRADMEVQYRTDREWHETLIKRLAWQLDCERRDALECGVTQTPKSVRDAVCLPPAPALMPATPRSWHSGFYKKVFEALT